METYDKIYKSICRLCLNYSVSEKMVPLIDSKNEDGLSVYGKAVLRFAKISIDKQDCLPIAMCIKCLQLLKQAIFFKFMCESNDSCLNKLISTDDYKQKIVEYTMLRFYFPNENLNTKKRVRKKEQQLKKPSEKTRNEVTLTCGKNNNDLKSVQDRLHSVQIESDCEENVLEKMENLIDSNVCDTIELRKPLKRKLRRKKLENKRRRMLLIQQRLSQKNTQAGNLVCGICNKVLANQHTYDHHMQRHNGCRYICEHCGKGFPVKTELQIHQVSKHGTGPYLQCSHCPFKAPRKFDLIEHERIHSGERPYTCEKCGLTFRRRGIWKKHLIYHTEKKIQCPRCPKKFFQRSEMLAHANNVHDRVYVYLCSKCGATYAKTATVRRHMTERHGIPREMQGKVVRINKAAGLQEQ
ncbi:hypothetical protein KGM_206570 [Danaus plexippus plexippus]|uniref:Uncharacterized protein n=1 Tax=Danaus plexippus plexippus TaxID=278856 RepID=A0A212FAV6_DANPL|nr:hypothetical protein KGM_206570 [Danaus plexippus plexippus]